MTVCTHDGIRNDLITKPRAFAASRVVNMTDKDGVTLLRIIHGYESTRWIQEIASAANFLGPMSQDPNL